MSTNTSEPDKNTDTASVVGQERVVSGQDDITKARWKTEPCHVGEHCWCRMISRETPLNGEHDDDFDSVAQAGSLDKKTAEHIVKVHNESLDL